MYNYIYTPDFVGQFHGNFQYLWFCTVELGNQPQAIYWKVEVSSLTNVSHLDPESASSWRALSSQQLSSFSVSTSGEVPEETANQ